MLLLRYKTRKLVFRGLIVLYIFAATWLLLFANGYRIQLKPLLFSATGNVLATFEPTTSNVYIDDILTGNSSPSRVRSLFPGVHRISISAQGYLPYERTITIEKQRTAFISDIFLVKDSAPVPYSLPISLPEASVPRVSLLEITGKDVVITTDAASGTRVVINGTPLTRDLGAGAWKIAGGDKNILAIARLETDEIQFRAWDNLDTVIATLPGHTIVPFVYSGSRSLIAVSAFEIWNFDTDHNTAELIYRFSSPIISAQTVPGTTLLIAALPDQVTAFHIGDHHYIPTILASGSILDATISGDGLSLFYSVLDGSSTSTSTFKRDLY